MKKETVQEKITHEEEYIQFLKKRLSSKNFQENAKEGEVEKTKEKLLKAERKLRGLKILL